MICALSYLIMIPTIVFAFLLCNSSFEIQCRTARAQGSSDINATEYVAFAMKVNSFSDLLIVLAVNDLYFFITLSSQFFQK